MRIFRSRLTPLAGAAALVLQVCALTSCQPAPPTASQLLAKMNTCSQISNGKYKTDSETARTVAVCGAQGGVFWKADMDIDCDGVPTTACNATTDPWFQDDTFVHTSADQPLTASVLPYVVIPSPSTTWDYRTANIRGGAVVAIIFNNKIEYAVFGDTGPTDIVGEASYASARDLGINANPETGGSDGPVTYLVFQGSSVAPVEDHAAAIAKGQQLARQFLTAN
jgi:hypothetical protein